MCPASPGNVGRGEKQIRGDLYPLTADEAEGGPPTYRGNNPDHGFDLSFAAGGLGLMRAAAGPQGAGQESSWPWELRATGYGYEGDVRPLPAPAETVSDGNRVEYRRPGLIEWYLNDERGLEHGFTLDAPPDGEGDLLVLEMALDTDLAPILTGDPAATAGQAIEFTRPRATSSCCVTATSMPATPRAHRSPRALLAGCGPRRGPGSCRLNSWLRTPPRAYPLRIDPLVTAPDWAALGENTGDEFGHAVSTAGDVNGDGYNDLAVGAWGNDEGGLSNRGKVYVYHGSPAGPGDTPAWFRSGDAAGDQFGYSVSTAGDVNGDGYDDLVVGAP